MNLPAIAANLNYPGFLAVNDKGDLYIAEGENNKIRKVGSIAIAVPAPTPTPTPTPIPSLSQWGLMVMAGLMAAVLMWRLRRRIAPEQLR